MKKIKWSGMKTLIVILIILIIVAGVLLGIKIYEDRNKQGEPISLGTEMGKEEEKKEFNIYPGTDRPIAVMIDNHKAAWPQAGLNDAYAVYEIIVEGGETRLMALFKGKDLEKIGPVRSARHYFLDYAMENNAIYVHYGWSPQAESDIATYKINNINGITNDNGFWRVKDKSAPHNAVTSTAKILELAKEKKYKTNSNQESVLNYTHDEVTLEDGQIANEIKIPYSTLHTVSYQYDESSKTYIRYARGTEMKDWETKEPVKTKNIIITFAENYTLKDPDNKDRQGLKNTGELDGYYITNGKAIKIKCQKEDRTKATVYKDLNGNKIEINDANTFIQICPIDAKVTIE